MYPHDELNILFTSAGRRSYLVRYFKEALHSEGVKGTIHVSNSTSIAPSFLEADQTFVTPLIYSEDYIPAIVEYCKKNKIKAVLSLFDIDVPVLSRNKDKFEKIGTQLLTVDYENALICNDKYATYKYLKENNIPVPKTYLHLSDVFQALQNDEISFPLVVKPRWGTGSISIFTSENENELNFFYSYVKKKAQETYLKYESSQNNDECVIIQQMLHGDEYGIDIINDLKGNYVNSISKKKISMRAGETDCAETVFNGELINLGSRISQLIHQPGILDVDAFVCDNTPYILELNARFGGGYPFSHSAGANLPRAIIRWLLGKDDNKMYCTAQYGILAQKDIHMIKYVK